MQDGAICMHDLRSNALTATVQVSTEAVPSLLLDEIQEYRVLACAGNDIVELDLRKVWILHLALLLMTLATLLCPLKICSVYLLVHLVMCLQMRTVLLNAG